MNYQDVEPQLGAESFSCPHCNAVAHQNWYSLFLKRESAAEVRVLTPEAPLVPTLAPGKSERREIPEIEQLVERLQKNVLTYVYQRTPQPLKVKLANLHVSHCHDCNGFAIWVGSRLLFPIDVEKMSAPLVEEDFEEAAEILNKSPRGAAALMRVCVQKFLPLLNDNGTDNSDYNSALMRKGLEVEIQQAMEVLQVLRSDPVQLTNFESQEDKELAFRFIDSLKEILERRALQNQGEKQKQHEADLHTVRSDTQAT